MEDKRTSFGIPNQKDSGWTRSRVFQNSWIPYDQIKERDRTPNEEMKDDTAEMIKQALHSGGFNTGFHKSKHLHPKISN